MSLARQPDSISEQDYLDGEKLSDVRHEYVDGQVFAMAGSSKRHNRIAGNFYRSFMNRGDCEAYQSDIKVRLQHRRTYYYPDVVVICEEEAGDEYYLESPCLVVEVLSRSTRQRDYQEKLLAYQTIPSLKTYLIASQDEMNIDQFHKDEQGNWWVSHFRQADDVLVLNCPQISLTLEEVYSGISFPADSVNENNRNNNGQ